MELDDFHLFPFLPTELRDTVWMFAIRPDRPSAHFFSLCYDGPESERASVLTTWASDFKDWRLQVSCPQFSKTPHSGYSWTDGNPSAYLLDAGLWAACHESREVMKRYHGLYQRNAEPEIVSASSVPMVTRPFACSKGLVLSRQITLFPGQDLLCLQPEPSYAPISKTTIGWFQKQNFRGFRNIAIEFKLSWSSETGLSGAFAALQWLHFAVQAYAHTDINLWLIDYSLCRQPGQPVQDKPTRCMEFYGVDRKYVEVQPGTEKWSRPGHPNSSGFWMSPEDILPIMYNMFSRRLRILACESM